MPTGIVTAFIGILDPATRTLTYASAGHPPPLVRSPSGEISLVGGSRLPLGLRWMHTYAPEPSLTVVSER